MLRVYSFSGLFHAQRSLQDYDGRGYHIEDDYVMCFAISNQSASFGFQHRPRLTGYVNGYGRLGLAKCLDANWS